MFSPGFSWCLGTRGHWSVLILAKPVVNMLITNAETHHLGAEPGDLDISPDVCSSAPLRMDRAAWIHSSGSSLMDPRYRYITFYCECALNILSQVVPEDCG